ncbi:DUF697 domain-containing protein [Verrucomicrobiota bacterium]
MRKTLLRIFHILRRILVVVAVVFIFFAAVEVLRVYQILRQTHVFLGYGFLAAVAFGLLWLLYPLISFLFQRKAPRPPQICNLQTAALADVRRYAKYVVRVERLLCRQFSSLDAATKSKLEKDASNLAVTLRKAISRDALVKTISGSLDDVLQPVFDVLNQKAEKIVRDTVGQVLLIVTASPWRSVDLFVVLQRNIQMVSRVSKVYSSSPTLKDQCEIFCGISEVVAFSGIVSLGSKFLERLLAWVPLIGKLVDDIAQGVGAGMMTSVVGHTAIARCRSFRKPWDVEETKRSIVKNTERFYLDIKVLLLKDTLGQLRNLIRGRAEGAGQKPEEAEKQLRSGVEEAFKETKDDAASCIKEPRESGAPGVMGRTVRTLGTVVRTAGYGIAVAGKKLGSTSAAAGRGVWRASRTMVGLVTKRKRHPVGDHGGIRVTPRGDKGHTSK